MPVMWKIYDNGVTHLSTHMSDIIASGHYLQMLLSRDAKIIGIT